MDPITAFSLAGTVVQFIDFGTKIFRVARQIFKGDTQGQKTRDEVESLTEFLRDALKNFGPSSVEHNNIESQDTGLLQLVEDCRKLGGEVLALVHHLGVKKDRKRDVVKVAFKIVWNENEVKSRQSRLDSFRSQLTVHLLVLLRQYAIETKSKQEEILSALGVVSETNLRLSGVISSILDHIVSRPLYSDRSETKRSLRNALLEVISQDHDRPGHFISAVQLSSSEESQRTQQRILYALHYEGMEDRTGRIAEAYESTFEWVFHNNDEYNLPHWLEGENQIYWITGKAGSGKSTLMKYLCQPLMEESTLPSIISSLDQSKKCQTRCQPYLYRWAANKKLLIASFYSWSSGTHLQMTRSGLLRSLLYQILQSQPGLIPMVMPSRWESLLFFDVDPQGWDDKELERALISAVKALETDHKLCFFIDGLDEFNGGHDSLVTFIHNLIRQSTTIKLCVASRPWVVFEDAFHTEPQLRMETLTYNDIKYYVSTNFLRNAEFSKLQILKPEFAGQLIENIVSKASGVFLWVHLVVASLLAGMSYGDRITDLQKRLDQLPPDLESLYEKMLRSLDRFYLEHAAQLLYLVEASTGPLPLIRMSFADEESLSSVLSMPASRMPPSRLDLRVDAMTRRLNSRWKGMLEVDSHLNDSGNLGDNAHQTVQYLHRSVKDFVQTSRVQRFLTSALRGPFDPHMSLCIAEYAYIKALPSRTAPTDRVRSCLYHASRVLPSSKDDMIQMLDDMARILPEMYKVKVSAEGPAALQYLGINWDAENKHNSFGQSFLSLAVIHNVKHYVENRVEAGCIFQKAIEPKGSFSAWSLLMDAVGTTPHHFEMIQCLLRADADPNYRMVSTGKTPWRMFLHVIAKTHNGRLYSVADLPKEGQLIVKAMVTHGADLDSAWKDYIPNQTNRFGSRIPVGDGDTCFTHGFFKELRDLPVKARGIEKRRKWGFKK